MEPFVRRALRSSTSIFDAFVNEIAAYTPRTIPEIKQRQKKKGDIWEEFCREYLVCKGYTNVRLLQDIPGDELATLSLRTKDMGIDIVAYDALRPVAVQCKFRNTGAISWRQLSTFEALCARTGPWHRHIVMTNATAVRREGRKQFVDMTISRPTFECLQRHEWTRLAGYNEGNVLSVNPVSVAEMNAARHKWLARFV